MKIEDYDKARSILRQIHYVEHLLKIYKEQESIALQNIENIIIYTNKCSDDSKYHIQDKQIKNAFAETMADKIMEMEKEIQLLQQQFDRL